MMTIKQVYELAIKMGTDHDLRGAVAVKKKLKQVNEKYDKLSTDKKKEFDQERLVNPFSDSRMFAKDPNKPVKRILAGIDIETQELLMAKELAKDNPINLVLSHHPIGPALAGLHEVMDLQIELLANYGIPINIAQSIMKIRLSEVSRSVAAANHSRVLDAAQLLGFDMICAHTATDNLVADYLDKLLKKKKSEIERIGGLVKVLKEIPEYQNAIQQKAGPAIFVGSEDNYVGKIALTEITGGTEGSKDMFEKMAQAGIGTVVGMHMHEEHKQEAEKHHINVVIAGHISSDSIGMNLFLDELEKKGVEVIPCSGLDRVKRFKTAIKTKSKKKK